MDRIASVTIVDIIVVPRIPHEGLGATAMASIGWLHTVLTSGPQEPGDCQSGFPWLSAAMSARRMNQMGE